MQRSNKNITILDCTIRDGGHLNNWNFDRKVVREVYRTLSKAGVDYIELGYRSSERYFDRAKYGTWRFTTEDDLREATDGIEGAKVSVMVDFGKIDSDDIIEKERSVIDLVRVAVYKDRVSGAAKFAESIKERGYEVSLNLMGYSNYSPAERRETLGILKDVNVDYVYFADSYGSTFPGQIKGLLAPLLELGKFGIGFHPHNNLQMAFANTVEAMQCGANLIDGSIYGMGRAAGNLPIEALLSYMQPQYPGKYNVIPVLNVIDKYFIELQKQTSWGYGLPYMLSGIFKCHPGYVKNLIERREYTVEDIWHILEMLKKINTAGFSKDALEAVLKEGIFGNNHVIAGARFKGEDNDEKEAQGQRGNEATGAAAYADRHAGRDFLVLANGPSLKNAREQIHDFITKYDPIILGANYLENLFVPHYHAFNNKRRFVSYADSVNKNSKLLIGQYIPKDMITEYCKRDYETLRYRDVLDGEFEIQNGVIQANCRTISVLLAGVAIAMGARRIFIAGMDGYLDAGDGGKYHFYTEKEESRDRDVIYEKHHWNLRFLEQIDNYLTKKGREGIHILTPTTYKTFYKGINNYI